jgi:hypothetical protein
MRQAEAGTGLVVRGCLCRFIIEGRKPVKLFKMALAVMLLAGVAGMAIGAAEKAPVTDTKAAAVAQPDTSRDLTMDQLPAAVKEQFLKQAGGNRIRGIATEIRNGKVTYDCDVFINGLKFEVITDADGKLLTLPLPSATSGTAAATTASAAAATTDTKAAATATPAYLHATLLKVDGKNLQVKTAATKGQPAKEMTVATDGKTKFILDYEEGKKLSDLAPDMTLTILPATGTAKTVKAHVKGLYGTVVKADGKNLVIMPAKGKKEVTVVTDDKTNVVIDGKGSAKLADLKAGTEVKVIPETGTAAKVAMSIPQPAPKKAAPAKTDTAGKTAEKPAAEKPTATK